MLWFLCITISILFGVADVFLLETNQKLSSRIHTVVRYFFLVNLTSFFVMKYALGIPNIFQTSFHSGAYPFKCAAVLIVVGLAIFMLRGFLLKVLQLEKTEPKHKKRAKAVKIISIVLFTLGMAAFTASLWGMKAYGNLAPDQIVVNIISPVGGGGETGVYFTVLEEPVLQTAFISAIFALITLSPYKLTFNRNEKSIVLIHEFLLRIVSFIIAVSMLFGGFAFGIEKFQLKDLVAAYFFDSPFIEENYIAPTDEVLTFPEQKRNLILIYLESMENTFLSKDLGGYMDENLVPDLTELANEGYVFSHTSNKLGGFIPSTGAGWSIASMVNMDFGVPMKVPTDANSYGSAGNFLPGAVGIGDLLHEQGYEQSALFGAEASFGGLDYYLKSHGNFNIIDHTAAIEKGLIPADYNVWWGYEDDKLYEFAKDELTRLYNTGKPFHLVMETADTHAPEGYLSPNAEKKFPDQYSNTIYYSQAEAVKFVRWIQEQPFYDNTTIFLIGDHLTMASCISDTVTNYQRTCFNLCINPPEEFRNLPEDRFVNRQWAAFDMFPTMLASIGVKIKGDKLGLGTNLFSNEKTIFEAQGIQNVNEKLVLKSNFYNDNFLKKPKK